MGLVPELVERLRHLRGEQTGDVVLAAHGHEILGLHLEFAHGLAGSDIHEADIAFDAVLARQDSDHHPAKRPLFLRAEDLLLE